jgi:hypothetical protein
MDEATGLDYWTGGSRLDYWTGPLDWVIGLVSGLENWMGLSNNPNWNDPKASPNQAKPNPMQPQTNTTQNPKANSNHTEANQKQNKNTKP